MGLGENGQRENIPALEGSLAYLSIPGHLYERDRWPGVTQGGTTSQESPAFASSLNTKGTDTESGSSFFQHVLSKSQQPGQRHRDPEAAEIGVGWPLQAHGGGGYASVTEICANPCQI